MTYDEICNYAIRNEGVIKDKVISLNLNESDVTLQLDDQNENLYIYIVIDGNIDTNNEDILYWISLMNFNGKGTQNYNLGILESDKKLIYSTKLNLDSLDEDNLISEIKSLIYSSNLIAIKYGFLLEDLHIEDDSSTEVTNSLEINSLQERGQLETYLQDRFDPNVIYYQG